MVAATPSRVPAANPPSRPAARAPPSPACAGDAKAANGSDAESRRTLTVFRKIVSPKNWLSNHNDYSESVNETLTLQMAEYLRNRIRITTPINGGMLTTSRGDFVLRFGRLTRMEKAMRFLIVAAV